MTRNPDMAELRGRPAASRLAVGGHGQAGAEEGNAASGQGPWHGPRQLDTAAAWALTPKTEPISPRIVRAFVTGLSVASTVSPGWT